VCPIKHESYRKDQPESKPSAAGQAWHNLLYLGKSLPIMAKRKRKPSKFTAGREARRRAREVAGPPPAERVIPDKRLKPPKHKKNLLEDSGG
jgi:hypothetical protein